MFKENVIPLRYGKGGLIIFQRQNIKLQLKDISLKLQNDVENEKNETVIEPNTVYGLKEKDQPWKRATLKFQKEVKAMQFLDTNGVVDVGPTVKIRKVRDRALREMAPGIMKMFVYGLHKFEPNDELNSIFEQLFTRQVISAVFTLVEKKENIVHECYVGDMFYQCHGKLYSFRELLIREKFTYPSMVDSENNRMIFEAVLTHLHSYNVLKGKTVSNQTRTLVPTGTLVETETLVPAGSSVDESRIPNFASQVDDFGLIEIIGEGTVRNSIQNAILLQLLVQVNFFPFSLVSFIKDGRFHTENLWPSNCFGIHVLERRNSKK